MNKHLVHVKNIETSRSSLLIIFLKFTVYPRQSEFDFDFSWKLNYRRLVNLDCPDG